jgi:cytochrome c oxidase subunit 3
MSTASIDRRVECSHHFDSMEQEHETCKQGLWLFMATEIMMFGALFVAYTIYRMKYPEVWAYGGELLDWKLGVFNTMVLITSSWTMALAVRDTQLGNNKRAFWMVSITTTICAFIFLIVKYFEYTHKIHAGLFPGLGLFTYEGAPENISLFLTIYFGMTGLHGIHILSWYRVLCFGY